MVDMRINGVINAYDNYSVAKDVARREEHAAGSKAVKANDNLFTVSSEGKDYQAIRKIVANVPDIREDKVARIKAQMENGTYNVSSADVASKILESAYLFEI